MFALNLCNTRQLDYRPTCISFVNRRPSNIIKGPGFRKYCLERNGKEKIIIKKTMVNE